MIEKEGRKVGKKERESGGNNKDGRRYEERIYK